MENKFAKIILRNQVYSVKPNSTIRNTLGDMDIQTDAHLIVRAGKLITDDEILQAGDEIQLIPVISGG
jgi:sulfur carrier protein ThiS